MRKLHAALFAAVALATATPMHAAEPVPYDVYPIGACDVERIEDLAVVRNLGFNCVEVFYSKATPEYLAEAERLGLKVIPFLFPGDAANRVDAEAIDRLNLEQHRDSRAIVAWFPIDEPSGGRVPEELCVETYRTIKARDPHRAIFTILNYSGQTADFKGSYDILGLDPYPIVYAGAWGGRLSMVANDIETAREHDATNPIWMVIQSFGNVDGWARMPTAAELTTMAAMGFVSGSEGTLYYPWYNRGHTYHTMNLFPDTLAEVARFNRALAAAAPALANPKVDRRLRDDPAFVRVLVADEYAYLFVVNGDYGARTITVESDSFEGAALVDDPQGVALLGRRVAMTFTDCGVLFAKLKLPRAVDEVEITVTSDPPRPRVIALNKIARVEAAELDPQSIYNAASIGDDSFITNWCSPRPYTLPFPVNVTFHEARPVSRITIHPLIIDGSGYDAWKDIRITTSDGQVLEKSYAKEELPYIFELSGSRVESFKLEVLTTHDKRNYLGIREIEVQ